MKRSFSSLLFIAGVLTLGACSNFDRHEISLEKPSAEEMRAALKELFKAHPELSLPEFDVSLKESPAIEQGGLTRIGAFDCDTSARSFEAVFSAPNLTLYHIEGRFDLDARHVWRAIPVRKLTTNGHNLDRRQDWFPSTVYSWSRPSE